MSLDRHDISGDVRQAANSARQSWQRWREGRPKAPRMLLLWLATVPLIPAAFASLVTGHLSAFTADALAYALFAVAAILARRGYLNSTREPRRRFSRRLYLPLLNVAGVLVGAATAITAIAGAGYAASVGLAFALVAMTGFFLAYGMQPWLKGERLEAVDRESRLVAEALAEAESRLIQIEQAAHALGNQELRGRLSRIAAHGRDILAQIAARPSDLSRARRFLTVFLEGAEQVSKGYVHTHRHTDSAELEQRFRSVLVTIEDQFIHQRQRLTQTDVTDLDIQIEVLQKQLEQEAIT
ncbi:5-bromo-4-chloroindolyl phosphate hydrolysis family protein [Thiorhodovibrio frisius]|uniref:5-bromo-4-chloroindolyl phosphate hydrolysis protein n=1 Tax=Thiorhodovibrio frisius TaxID=631362 RepID=H8Z4V5_9GAMM|nr:5-bromo-4-chloroindolyl phosphate hydrolysis family protein [Thiorhodovibrio frisius]EIC20362.1 5-bromo-4-chloroindolyl phosphate hydrolysis protein [Thiorhodovibrio frisius]WPL21102.1 5-bromo-4-chloroindolyl phosphate hydrolysis protein [Thiorhodovibrio frisius]